jgi:hypothetical protein
MSNFLPIVDEFTKSRGRAVQREPAPAAE